MNSIELCTVGEYKILGNSHTIEQFYKRHINGDIVKSMVSLSAQKMAVQKTYAIIRGNIKLLVLRIDTTKFFVITCLVSKMRLKKGTVCLYV